MLPVLFFFFFFSPLSPFLFLSLPLAGRHYWRQINSYDMIYPKPRNEKEKNPQLCQSHFPLGGSAGGGGITKIGLAAKLQIAVLLIISLFLSLSLSLFLFLSLFVLQTFPGKHRKRVFQTCQK
jgi:hypothetical protein